MAYTNRGGPGWARKITVTATGGIAVPPGTAQADGKPFTFPSPTSRLVIGADTNTLRVYFTQLDFDLDRNFFTVNAGTDREIPLQARELWFKGQGGTSDVDLIGVSKV